MDGGKEEGRKEGREGEGGREEKKKNLFHNPWKNLMFPDNKMERSLLYFYMPAKNIREMKLE